LITETLDRTLISTRVLYFLYFAAFGIFVTYIDIYFRSLGYSGVQIGWINSVLALVAIGAGPVWGLLSDRHGAVRPYLAAAVIGTAVVAFGISRIHALALMLPAAAFFSFFRQPLLPLLDSSTMQVIRSRPEMYGRQRAWGTLGFILTTWGFGLLLARAGLIWLFAGYIGILLLMLVVIRLMPGSAALPDPPRWSSLAVMLRDREWRLLSGSIVILGIGDFSMHHFLGIHIKELGSNEALVGIVASLGALAELPVFFWGAPLLRRFGPWRLLLFACSVSALRLFLYGIMPTASWAVPISLLNSVTFGVFWIAGVAYVDRLAPANMKATSQGLLYTAMGVGGVLGGPISGSIFDSLGANWLFIASGVMALGAFGLLSLARPSGLQTVV
jgi:PPP family 3-phenylpropionic acid transporter